MEFLKNLLNADVGVSVSLALFLIGFFLGEFLVNVCGAYSRIHLLGFPFDILLLSLDDVISYGLVSQVVTKDVFQLVASDSFLFDVSYQLFADQYVFDELLKDYPATLDCFVFELLLCFLVATSH